MRSVFTNGLLWILSALISFCVVLAAVGIQTARWMYKKLN